VNLFNVSFSLYIELVIVINMASDTVLSHLGFGVLKASLSSMRMAELKKAATLVPKNPARDKAMGFSSSQPVRFWSESATRLYLPKHVGLAAFNDWVSKKVFPRAGEGYEPAGPDTWTCTGKLRPLQEEAAAAYLTSEAKGMDGVISMGCGEGKTVTSLHICSVLNARAGAQRFQVLVIVNEEDLGEQWIDRIKSFLPNVRVGRIQRDLCEVEGKDIVVGMLQSLALRKTYDPALLQRFGMIIVDECHIIGSEVYTKCLLHLNAPRMMGLSATPRRKDGLSDAIHMFLGPVVFKSERPPDEGVQVRILPFHDKDEGYSTIHYSPQGTIAASTMITQIANWRPRNVLIAQTVADILSKEPTRQILIIADRLEQLATVKQLLLDEHGIDDVGYYVGRKGKSKANHRATIEESVNCTVLLGTYMKAKQGLDVVGLSCIVLGTPQPDVEQATGRILRKLPTDRELNPLIIDIWDTEMPNYTRQLNERKRYYKKCGYTIEGGGGRAVPLTPLADSSPFEEEGDVPSP
jgi:superfamily II DNA or RNA helicase